MHVSVLLGLLLGLPVILLIAWCALSSCLGDSFRAQFGGVTINSRMGSYGRSYARHMTSGAGQGGWEQIEMEDMMDGRHDSEED
ncbi:hypothetical protein KVT40_003843 [Elsinoe batatas]|uniref:Uncharacterized protein n=1 Tax=Elsinoe batatas TaxID=2601811 RepID=A0A8K0L5R3_9PEZI|nr:hypothetical protein KVT40_003843 [Elsinoe batatas]